LKIVAKTQNPFSSEDESTEVMCGEIKCVAI